MNHTIGSDCFSKLLLERQSLIRYGIWNGLDNDSLFSWKKNFKTDEEMIFAAYVLDLFVYRNQQHMISMLYDVLTRHLNNLWRQEGNPLYSERNTPLNILSNKYDNSQIRYIGAIKRGWPQTKSGFRIIHLLTHHLQICEKWNATIYDIPQLYADGVKTFLIFDDIICTGTQMSEVLDEINYKQFPDARFYICLCAAHEKGIKKLESQYPWAKVVYAEKILDCTTIFDSIVPEILNLNEDVTIKEWYRDFMRRVNFRGPNIYGTGDLSMLYAFCESVPNNSLPILYHKTEQFNPLLKKRQ